MEALWSHLFKLAVDGFNQIPMFSQQFIIWEGISFHIGPPPGDHLHPCIDQNGFGVWSGNIPLVAKQYRVRRKSKARS